MTWSDGNIYFDQGGCCNADTRTYVAEINNLNAWDIIALRSNAVNERSIWENGSNLQSNTTAPAAINLDGRAVNLATSDEYGGSSSTWSARIGQFVVYNRALSDAEMAQVYTYLKPRVGL